jgi:hypothetical protein
MLAGAKTVRARDRVQVRRSWLTTLRRYLFAMAIANLAWEFVQMPLFTLWRTGTPRQVTFAALHCTAGDLGIATASLALALGLFGAPDFTCHRSSPSLPSSKPHRPPCDGLVMSSTVKKELALQSAQDLTEPSLARCDGARGAPDDVSDVRT